MAFALIVCIALLVTFLALVKDMSRRGPQFSDLIILAAIAFLLAVIGGAL